MAKTADPDVVIEARAVSYVRYRSLSTGRRWEVHGICDRRGDCLVGAVIDGIVIRDHEQLARLVQAAGTDRIDSPLDVPVTPEFRGCCPFTYVELPS